MIQYSFSTKGEYTVPELSVTGHLLDACFVPSLVLSTEDIGWVRSSSTHQGTHSLILDTDIKTNSWTATWWEWWWEQAQGIVGTQKGTFELTERWGRLWEFSLEEKVLKPSSAKCTGIGLVENWGERRNMPGRENSISKVQRQETAWSKTLEATQALLKCQVKADRSERWEWRGTEGPDQAGPYALGEENRRDQRKANWGLQAKFGLSLVFEQPGSCKLFSLS